MGSAIFAILVSYSLILLIKHYMALPELGLNQLSQYLILPVTWMLKIDLKIPHITSAVKN